MIVTENPKALNEVSFEQRARELQQEERDEQKKKEKERKSPYAQFYQVNKKNSKYLSSCLKENPRALAILFFLFDHMDRYNAVVCSYKVLQEALEMSQATVARSVKYLKDHGFLYVYKTGTSNVYVVNDELVWNSWGKNVEYCQFPANIILSKSEQEKQANVKDKRMTTVMLKEQAKNETEREASTNII